MKAALVVSLMCVALVTAQDVRFDVASIHPSASAPRPTVGAGLRITGTQATFSTMSIKDLVGLAYGLPPSRIVGPDWLAQERFDVAATIPAGATRAQVPAMLQALLADRFQLRAHRETRDLPVYALTIAKSGLRMTALPPADDAAPPAALVAGGSGSVAGVSLDLGQGATFTLAGNAIEGQKLTFGQLADVLSRFTDRTVTDATDETGRYSFKTSMSPEDYEATLIRSAVNAGVVLPPQALRFLDAAPGNPLGNTLEQLGLNLTPRTAPIEILVVDSALKVPTEN